MICSESCNLQPDGTLFRGRHPKNASETLCVGTNMNNFPISNDLAFYQETYRGIGFHRTTKGYWLFDAVPPPGKLTHWADYGMPEDFVEPDGLGTAPEVGAAIMRRMIDRCLNDDPSQRSAR